MLALLIAQGQQSEYGQMTGLVLLLVILGILAVAIPRFRRVDLLTDKEKKKLVAQTNRNSRPRSAGH